MKKIILILISTVFLSASAQDAKSQLINQILKVLVPNGKVSLYIDDKSYKNIKILSKRVMISQEEEKANVIITDKSLHVKNNKKSLILLTTYKAYRNTPNAIGALFWQKGRPNLIFSKKRIEELNIKLPTSFLSYVE